MASRVWALMSAVDFSELKVMQGQLESCVPLPEPELFLQKRWRCPFCRKSLSKRERMYSHMGTCWRNPQMAACGSCVHYDYTNRDCAKNLRLGPTEGEPYPYNKGCVGWEQ